MRGWYFRVLARNASSRQQSNANPTSKMVNALLFLSKTTSGVLLTYLLRGAWNLWGRFAAFWPKAR